MSIEYTIHKIELKDDYEGRVEATLLNSDAASPSTKALLYVHGYNDYFFHDHMAKWANDSGYNFYALDMRKYGRSILPHQKPNMFRDVSEYFEELDYSIDFIRSAGNKKVFLLGHSTGGLVSTIYAQEGNGEHKIDALVLNSPYFENNVPPLARKLVMPLLAMIGRFFPASYTGIKLEDGYAKSIHQSGYGEWDYDLSLKPFKSFAITFGWMRGLNKAQKKVHRGLDINCPVLVLYSSDSVPPGKYHDNMHTADAVLNVTDIEKYAQNLGKNVSRVKVAGGTHDLALSNKEAREYYFQSILEFLNQV